MNRTTLLGGLAAASLMLIAGAASAQAVAPETHGLRADTDHDGRLSRAEFVEARLAPLTAMDADKDGMVTVVERTASRTTRAATHAARRFERLDTDKDGVISRAEFDATASRARPEAADGSRANRAARPTGRHAGRHAGLRLGPRHTGTRPGVEAGRARAATPVVIAEVRAKAEAAFDRLDADKDGFLVSAELQAARRAMRDRREARHGMNAGHGAQERAQDRPAREARREARRQRREMASPSAPASE